MVNCYYKIKLICHTNCESFFYIELHIPNGESSRVVPRKLVPILRVDKLSTLN